MMHFKEHCVVIRKGEHLKDLLGKSSRKNTSHADIRVSANNWYDDEVYFKIFELLQTFNANETSQQAEEERVDKQNLKQTKIA